MLGAVCRTRSITDDKKGLAMTKQTLARHFRWDDMPKEQVTDMISRRIVTGDRSMVTHIYLDKGAKVAKHAHENEQFTYVLQGALRLWIGEDESYEVDVRAGEILHIPSNVPHRAEALEDTFDVDVFTPPRQDWLDGTDTYFHEQ